MASSVVLSDTQPQRRGVLGFAGFLAREMLPKGRIFTVFNVISVAIMATAAWILYVRFTQGLGAVTNLSQEFPWGIWKGFNVVAGVALAGGAYVVTFMVYILRLEKYRPIVRVTVLNGFLAYCFYAGALLLELGRPWNVFNPIIGNSFGLSSVLFLVAWHFMLYITAQMFEFSPAAAEWLGLRRIHRILSFMTLGAVILGISLSTLHQSGLGALFLMAKTKIHPLWYTEMIPILFFISSIFAGLTMVIFEGSISHRVFQDRIGPDHAKSHDAIVIGLARVAGAVMFVYLFLELLNIVHGQLWPYLKGPWAAWYLFEVIGLVAVPMTLLLFGAASRRIGLIRIGAALAVLGVIVNRLNVALIAFRWNSPHHYVPTWQEVVVTAAVICVEIWVFRWVVRRMPVLSPGPEWARHGTPAHGRRSALPEVSAN